MPEPFTDEEWEEFKQVVGGRGEKIDRAIATVEKEKKENAELKKMYENAHGCAVLAEEENAKLTQKLNDLYETPISDPALVKENAQLKEACKVLARLEPIDVGSGHWFRIMKGVGL